MDLEKTELSQKNSQNQRELQELNQRLAEVLCQEKEPGRGTLEEWQEEKSALEEELERCKVQVRAAAAPQPLWRKSQQIKEMLIQCYISST